jgi:hypothetical protein
MPTVALKMGDAAPGVSLKMDLVQQSIALATPAPGVVIQAGPNRGMALIMETPGRGISLTTSAPSVGLSAGPSRAIKLEMGDKC